MPDSDHQHIKIILTFLCEDSIPESRSDSFWKNIKRCGYDVMAGNPKYTSMCTDHLHSFFPANLARYISMALPSTSDSYVPEMSSFHAKVVAVTEGTDETLDIGLQFQNPGRVAELFAYNLNFFDLFLRSYAPVAFIKSLQVRPAHLIPWLGLLEKMRSGLVIDRNLLKLFNTNQEPNAQRTIYSSSFQPATIS